MSEAIRFYCGIGEAQWNHHPVAPGPYACISPVYGNTVKGKRNARVWVPDGTLIIQDSGAFSDGPGQRLSFEDALARQVKHAETYGFLDKVTHRASYDLLIDEKWIDGVRYKARWTEEDAEMAVKLTVKAAQYLSGNRHGLSAILSAQGVSAKQYLKCAQQIVPLLEPGDIFGLGGWCITGKLPAQIMPVFLETMHIVIPFLGAAQVKRVHIWGVCYAKALGELLCLCDEYGIALSTDSMGPSIRPARGQWGYAEWIDHDYIRPEPEVRGLERARHVEATRQWLADFRSTPNYRRLPKQLSMWEVSHALA